MKLVLASKSPRRVLLLKEMGLVFEQAPSSVNELGSGEGYCKDIPIINAHLKALDIAIQYPNDLVLGVDTVVLLDNEVIGKPKDSSHAVQILEKLSGKTHEVLSAVNILCQAEKIDINFAVTSKVKFKALSQYAINSYLSQVNVLDKAGAYAAQEHGSLVIDSIDGSYSNVMGLPCERLSQSFRMLGRYYGKFDS